MTSLQSHARDVHIKHEPHYVRDSSTIVRPPIAASSRALNAETKTVQRRVDRCELVAIRFEHSTSEVFIDVFGAFRMRGRPRPVRTRSGTEGHDFFRWARRTAHQASAPHAKAMPTPMMAEISAIWS